MYRVDLRRLRKEKGRTQGEIAEILGLDQSTISRIERTDQPLEDREFQVLKGVFSDIMGFVAEDEPARYSTSKILYVPQPAEAGFLSGEVSPLTNDDLEEYPGIPTFNDSGYAFTVSGESMLDTLRPGEVVITGTDPIRHISQIKKGYLYVVDTDAAILVKRITAARDGKVVLSSDNRSYKDITVSFLEIRHIWQARRVISFNLQKRVKYED